VKNLYFDVDNVVNTFRPRGRAGTGLNPREAPRLPTYRRACESGVNTLRKLWEYPDARIKLSGSGDFKAWLTWVNFRRLRLVRIEENVTRPAFVTLVAGPVFLSFATSCAPKCALLFLTSGGTGGCQG